MNNPRKLRSAVRASCKDLGIDVRKTEAGLYWLLGPGIEIVTVDLVHIYEADLLPLPHERWRGPITLRQAAWSGHKSVKASNPMLQGSSHEQ